MLVEHQVISGLMAKLASAKDAVSAAVTAAALRAVSDTHLAKENDQILPLLTAASHVSVVDLLSGMHDLIGGEREAPPEPTDHACGCHEVDAAGLAELDARSIQHATIFGALDGVAPGRGLVLVAPHDPLPLLAQLEKRAPGTFAIEYLERGPDAWRLSLVRAELAGHA